MPELPDVETMRRYLQSTALHKRIEDLEIKADILIPSEDRSDEKAVKQLKTQTVGHSFVSTRRHGKWLFAELNDNSDKSFVFHFGMMRQTTPALCFTLPTATSWLISRSGSWACWR